MKRIFVGIPLPKHVRDHVALLSQRLGSSPCSNTHQQSHFENQQQPATVTPRPLSSLFSFTEPHLFHITLHFIGNASQEQITTLCQILEQHFAIEATVHNNLNASKKTAQVTIPPINAWIKNRPLA